MKYANGDSSSGPSPAATQPTWSSWSQAFHLIGTPQMLRRTMLIAVVVGTILSIINQAHIVAAGQSETMTWLRVAANYVVPFIVSNAGALSVTRKEPNDTGGDLANDA